MGGEEGTAAYLIKRKDFFHGNILFLGSAQRNSRTVLNEQLASTLKKHHDVDMYTFSFYVLSGQVNVYLYVYVFHSMLLDFMYFECFSIPVSSIVLFLCLLTVSIFPF